MTEKCWTKEQMAAFVDLHGLKNTSPEEIERLALLATRVARTGSEVPRMPSKAHEPASIFKVPQ